MKIKFQSNVELKPIILKFKHTTYFFLVSLGGVRLSPLGTSATVGLLYQPRMMDDDYGAVGGMRIGKGNRSTRIKPTPVPLCPPQIPHDLAWDRTRAAAVGSQRLAAWAMARSSNILSERVLSSGIYRSVVRWVSTDVSEDHVVYLK
jgi:hypothetical protein